MAFRAGRAPNPEDYKVRLRPQAEHCGMSALSWQIPLRFEYAGVSRFQMPSVPEPKVESASELQVPNPIAYTAN